MYLNDQVTSSNVNGTQNFIIYHLECLYKNQLIFQQVTRVSQSVPFQYVINRKFASSIVKLPVSSSSIHRLSYVLTYSSKLPLL